MFQGYQLLSKLSAAENVAYPLMLRGMEPDQRRLLALKALRQVGLSGREDARPSQLSGGQQQRVALARALCCKPKLLLCDEPTGALDPASRDDILALLDGWNRRGNTVVVITHDPVVAAQAATRYHAQPGGQLIRVQ